MSGRLKPEFLERMVAYGNDFIKSIGLSAKELNETRYWLFLIQSRKWVRPTRLESLMDETNQLLAICKTLVARAKRKGKQ